MAVADLEDAIEYYERTFGMRLVNQESNPDQGVREAMMAVGDSGSYVQLLAPLTPDSPIGKFLQRSGPGLQQVAYRVTDIDAACAELRSRGLRLLYDEPRRGTAGALHQLRPPQGRWWRLARSRAAAASAPIEFQPATIRPEADVQHIVDAIMAGDASEADFAAFDVPDHYTAALLRKDDETMFEGMPTRERDPRKAIHIEDVPVPEIGPGEALVAVMASAINYNTVWSAIFEPVSTFSFLRRYGKLSPLTKRHDLPYHVLGSDLAGVVLRTGPGVNVWKPGDEVVAHCASVELESPLGHNDTMLDPEQRIWGFETNFGGLAQLALVKANQLLKKPSHLTWEEAASPGLVNSTAYRQLVSRNGAGMKQGDVVLIWGASGGLGSYATQMALNGGGIPVCVVSSPRRPRSCAAWAQS